MNKPPICYNCEHKLPPTPETPFVCAAFPKAIPLAIIENRADHREPFEGDNGIRFKAIDPDIPFPDFTGDEPDDAGTLS
jgi:hypothetical protein